MDIVGKVKPKFILYGFVIFSLVLGVFIAADFGVSMDDDVETQKSLLSKYIYQNQLTRAPGEAFEDFPSSNDKYYGTASLVLIRFIEEYFFPESNHQTMVVAHFGYFVFFQIAVISIYFLLKYFVNDWGSLIGALLFGTQPLLFGHAFINSKDIPLTAVFLAAVVTGFYLIDRWEEDGGEYTLFAEGGKQQIVFLVVLLLVFTLLWSGPSALALGKKVVYYSFSHPGSFLGTIFTSLTTSGSLEGYLALVQIKVLSSFRWLVLFAVIILVGLFYWTGKQKIFGNYINLFTLIAAGVWGFAISTRVIAIVAGGIVGIYGLYKIGKVSIFPLVIYTMTAGMVSVITWPFLWVYGLKGLFEAFVIFGDYAWDGDVLFEGINYGPHTVPARYVPEMMALQFTEPVVIFGLIGFLLCVYLLYRREIDPVKTGLVLAWFFLPLLYIVITRPTAYNNFRQYFFITPPIFVMASIVLEKIFHWIKKPTLIFVMCILILAPGVVGIYQLHPLQYIYYNSFTGGVQGAEGKYPLDYWNTGFVLAMDYLNEIAPRGSEILVWKEDLHARVYDLADKYSFKAHSVISPSEYTEFDYAIVSTTQYIGIEELTEYPIIYSVKIAGVELLSVLKISDGL